MVHHLAEDAGRSTSRLPGSVAEAVTRGRQLRAVIAERGAAIDAAGQDPAEVMDLVAESGIQALNVPRAFGGLAGDSPLSELRACMETWIEVAAGDGSVGQLWGFGALAARKILSDTLIPDDIRAQIAHEYLFEGLRLSRLTSERGAARPMTGRRVAGGIVVSGTKAFGTNTGRGGLAAVPHLLIDDRGDLTGARHHLAYVRLESVGVRATHDWNNMGQRATDSQTLHFDHVFVPDGWHHEDASSEVFYTVAANVGLAALMHGIGEGAFDATVSFLRRMDRASMPMFDSPAADPVAHRRLGEMATSLAASRALVLGLAQRVQEFDPTAGELAEMILPALQADLVARHTALDVSSQLFELTGARSTAAGNGLDRFWRNVRTMSTHHPRDSTNAFIGATLLNGAPPSIADYVNL